MLPAAASLDIGDISQQVGAVIGVERVANEAPDRGQEERRRRQHRDQAARGEAERTGATLQSHLRAMKLGSLLGVPMDNSNFLDMGLN